MFFLLNFFSQNNHEHRQIRALNEIDIYNIYYTYRYIEIDENNMAQNKLRGRMVWKPVRANPLNTLQFLFS